MRSKFTLGRAGLRSITTVKITFAADCIPRYPTSSDTGGLFIKEVIMRTPQLRERKKARTATRGKRYRCTICRKKSPKPTTVPYYCPEHEGHRFDDSREKWEVQEKRDKKKFIR